MNTPTLFVAFSHTLTQSQIDGFNRQYGNIIYAPEYLPTEKIAVGYDTNIVTLAEVAPKLQKQMSNIPATATLEEIQNLAKAIVAEAVKVGATHFYCVGEPTLFWWANSYAACHFELQMHQKDEPVQLNEVWSYATHTKGFAHTFKTIEGQQCPPLICIQSTTERRTVEVTNPDTQEVTKTQVFQHVMWREMF